MNKVMVGVAIGLAAAAGYFAGRMQERGEFDKLNDNLNRLLHKAKRNAKNIMDVGQNEIEYVQDRVEYIANKGQQRVNKSVEDAE